MAKILICDDERQTARLAEVNLKRQGYEVSVCDNAFDCLAALRREAFEFLILDESIIQAEILQGIELDASLNVIVIPMRKPKGPTFPSGLF